MAKPYLLATLTVACSRVAAWSLAKSLLVFSFFCHGQQVAKMQQQERALSALPAKVAELETQQLQTDATVQAALDLFLQHLETSTQNLEVKAQIWASQDDKKLEDQLQQAAAKQQDMDKTRQEFASRIAKVEQQWQQVAVDEKAPQQHLRACECADDAQGQLQQASTDNASQPIEGLRRGEHERANESACKQERETEPDRETERSDIRTYVRTYGYVRTYIRTYVPTYIRFLLPDAANESSRSESRQNRVRFRHLVGEHSSAQLVT